MIDFIHKDAYWQDSIDKQLKIELEDGTIIDNSMIYSEEFELEENLCSDDTLRFGSCEASCVKFRIFAIPNNLVGQKINISEVVGGQTDNPMQIGKYKIASATPAADRDCIDVVAYDSMYDIIHSDVAEWYNNQFKATTTTETDTDGNTVTTTTYSTTTLKKFRDSFFLHFGIEQVSADLPNDNMIVSKTIEIVPNGDGVIGETLSGSSVIEAICEINGCFGHINRNGKFEYVFLQPIAKELFPSDDLFPSNDLFPASDNAGIVIYNWQYEPVEYEDYDVQPITQVQITQEENDIGITVGEDGNKYILDSNFLAYSLSDEELKEVGTNILSEVRKAKYTPIKANVIGNPCVMLGDIIKIVTNTKILYSYVLNRSLSGCQSLMDDIEAKGEEYRSLDVNSTNAQIKKLQGRSNVLERSIDETRSTIKNVERGLKSEIKQTADSITQEIENRKSEDNVLSSKIEQTADSITQEVEDRKSEDGVLSSKIEQTSESITSEVTRATKAEGELASSIEQTASEIVLKVDANGKIVEVALSADPKEGTAFTLDADNIDLTANDIFNIIAGNELNLTAKNISIDSTNFSVDKDGNVKCSNAEIAGYVKANTLNVLKEIKMTYSSAWLSGAQELTAMWLEQHDPNPYAYLYQADTTFNNIKVGTIAYTSSKLAKRNVKPLSNDEALKILNVNVVSFDYKYGGGKDQRGVIYEEVKNIIPSVTFCRDNDYKKHYKQTGWCDMPGVDYSKFVPYLIKMVQIQQEEIDELKSALQKLTERMDKYEQSI